MHICASNSCPRPCIDSTYTRSTQCMPLSACARPSIVTQRRIQVREASVTVSHALAAVAAAATAAVAIIPSTIAAAARSETITCCGTSQVVTIAGPTVTTATAHTAAAVARPTVGAILCAIGTAQQCRRCYHAVGHRCHRPCGGDLRQCCSRSISPSSPLAMRSKSTCPYTSTYGVCGAAQLASKALATPRLVVNEQQRAATVGCAYC